MLTIGLEPTVMIGPPDYVLREIINGDGRGTPGLAKEAAVTKQNAGAAHVTLASRPLDGSWWSVIWADPRLHPYRCVGRFGELAQCTKERLRLAQEKVRCGKSCHCRHSTTI